MEMEIQPTVTPHHHQHSHLHLHHHTPYPYASGGSAVSANLTQYHQQQQEEYFIIQQQHHHHHQQQQSSLQHPNQHIQYNFLNSSDTQLDPNQNILYPDPQQQQEQQQQHLLMFNGNPTEEEDAEQHLIITRHQVKIEPQQQVELEPHPQSSPHSGKSRNSNSVGGSPSKMRQRTLSAHQSPSTSTPPSSSLVYDESANALPTTFTDHQQKLAAAFMPSSTSAAAAVFLQHATGGELPFQLGTHFALGGSETLGDAQEALAANGRSSGESVGGAGGSKSQQDRKRPYPCSTCSSRFGSKMELEEHQNSHTGQKPFECDVCQSRFNRRSTLWNHKRIHSDAKPFSCTICQMTFKWKNSLKCHKEMHMRKNETSAADIDTDIMTYATAAKKKMAESSVNGLPPMAAIQTVSTRRKPGTKKAAGKAKRKQPPHEQLQNSSSYFSLNLFGQQMMDQQLNGVPQLGRNHLVTTNDNEQQQQQQSNNTTNLNAQQQNNLALAQNQFVGDLDLSQHFNQESHQLLMQAIYSGAATSVATANQHQVQSQLGSDEATSGPLDLLNAASSFSAPGASFNLDLLQPAATNLHSQQNAPQQHQTATTSLFLDASAGPLNVRLPTGATAFPMNILEFQLTADRNSQQQQQQQQQQLSYNMSAATVIATSSSSDNPMQLNVAETLQQSQNFAQNHQQNGGVDMSAAASMLNYNNGQQQQRVTDALLDDVQQFYHQQTGGALDPSLLLNHQAQQQQLQTNQSTDPFQFNSDYMLNGTPVYPFNQQQQQQQSQQNLMDSTQNLHLQAQNQHQNLSVQNAAALNAAHGFNNLMDDMSNHQLSQEELQNLAKMLPYDKW